MRESGGGEPCERLFFALWPDDAERCAMAQATAHAVSACAGRPVAIANLHVTLVFLGSVPLRRIPELHVLGRQAALAEPLQLTFDHLEHWAKPQVLCAASSAPSPGVAKLARQLQTLTLEAGFSPDIKPLRPHVTLARKVPHSTGFGHPGHAAPIKGLTWTLNGFALIASRTDRAGSVYSKVESYGLYGA